MACEDEGDDHDHEHCEDFDNQVDCEASDDCEWHDHGGESVCEDAGSHCEDFDNQADCEASDHCEWHEHGGENVCEDIGGDCDSDAHANVDGLIIEHDGVEIYRQFQGLVEGSLEVPVNYTKDLSVHFLDQDGEEIDFSPAECYPIYFHDYDMSIISIEMEEGDDHDHDHDHDDHEGNVFELTGLSTGFTTFQIEVWHDGHADYTSMQIPVTVIDEVHCEDFITESDCEDNSEYCEWHADEGACEEEGHDHEEHCEDFATEADCDAADHCEWHADDMACEDEGHHEDCDGLDGDVNNDSVLNIIDITTTVAVLLGNYAWTDECQETYADFNDDGSVNIVDIVTMVQAVLNGRINDYATLVQFEKTNSGVTFEANGYVGAIQMTLSHNSDFKLDITNNAMISDYKKTDNLTTLIIVAPEDNNLFSSEGFFNIENVVAASSDNYINTEVYTPADFTISNAYPNPFNPSTSFSIELSADSDISIKVFDVMGNLVEVVSEGEFSPGSYAFNWNAESASSGVYFINTVVGNSVSSQKVLLVK